MMGMNFGMGKRVAAYNKPMHIFDPVIHYLKIFAFNGSGYGVFAIGKNIIDNDDVK